MQPITIQFAVRVGYVRTIRISRENNKIHIDLPDGSTDELLHVYLGDDGVFGLGLPTAVLELNSDWLDCFNNMDRKIGLEMSLIVVEAIYVHARCAGFTILTATVSDIFGGQTNSSILD